MSQLRCPACSAVIGGPTADGELKINGLAVMLIGDDMIKGPCARCRQDIVIAKSFTGSPLISKALDYMAPRRRAARRVVEPLPITDDIFVVDDETR